MASRSTCTPTTTKQRNATEQRIVRAVETIAARGALAFAREALVRERFEQLAPPRVGKKKAAPKPVTPA